MLLNKEIHKLDCYGIVGIGIKLVLNEQGARLSTHVRRNLYAQERGIQGSCVFNATVKKARRN